MRKLLICFFIAACSKTEVAPPGLIFCSDGVRKLSYETYTVTAQAWCTKKLYTITAGKDLLLSFVTDSALHPGQFPAALNYWGNYSEDVIFTVSSNSWYFQGRRSHGVLVPKKL